MRLGFPTALQMLFEVGLFTSTVILAGTFGALPQAANQIALKLASTTFMIAVGVCVAATIRVGNQIGLKNYVKLRRLSDFIQYNVQIYAKYLSFEILL